MRYPVVACSQRVRRLLGCGQQRGDVRTDSSADEIADVALALIQGAFVIILATRDVNSLDSVTKAPPTLC